MSGMEKYKGIDAYKVLVTFKGARYVNYVSPKGVILMTKDPTQSLSTEMVGSTEEATKGQELPTKTLAALFKTLPGSTLPAGSATEPAKEENSKANAVNIDSDKSKKLGTPKQDLPKGISVPPGKEVGGAEGQ